MGTARRPHREFHSSPPAGAKDLAWNRPGGLSRGETTAKLGHWQVPAWADAPDGGRYWILPEGEYDTYSPEGTTWTAWVLYDDGRWPTQLARNVNGQRAYDAVIEHKNYTLWGLGRCRRVASSAGCRLRDHWALWTSAVPERKQPHSKVGLICVAGAGFEPA